MAVLKYICQVLEDVKMHAVSLKRNWNQAEKLDHSNIKKKSLFYLKTKILFKTIYSAAKSELPSASINGLLSLQ
jgi:hypothetical protein